MKKPVYTKEEQREFMLDITVLWDLITEYNQSTGTEVVLSTNSDTLTAILDVKKKTLTVKYYIPFSHLKEIDANHELFKTTLDILIMQEQWRRENVYQSQFKPILGGK